MAFVNRKPAPYPYSGFVGHRGMVTYIHIFTIGAAGAITSQEATKTTSVVATKTATKTGRYTLQIPCTFSDLLWADTWLVGPPDAVFNANNTSGLMSVWRSNDIDSGNRDGTIEVQFVNGSAFADAELPSGTVVYVRLDCRQGINS